MDTVIWFRRFDYCSREHVVPSKCQLNVVFINPFFSKSSLGEVRLGMHMVDVELTVLVPEMRIK